MTGGGFLSNRNKLTTMNTTERIYAVIAELQDIADSLSGGVPMPPPVQPPKDTIKIPVFSDRIERGDAKLHLVQAQKSDSMGTTAETAVYPMSVINVDGKLLFYSANRSEQTAWCEPYGRVYLDAKDDGFILNDVAYHNGTYWMLAERDNEIIIANADNGIDFKYYATIDTHGAKDTRHAFGYIGEEYIYIYGRTRGADWNEDNERWADRRGVKELIFNLGTKDTLLIYTIDPIDHVGGRNAYKRARIRPSYYSSDATMIGDTELMNIGVYFQDDERQTDRTDRPNGTGATYPVPFVNINPLRELTDSLLPLDKHLRPSANGAMEVGQIHAGSFAWIDGDLVQPYVVRNDTHYEFDKIPFKPTEHFLARWEKGRLAYLTDGTVTVEGKIVDVDCDGDYIIINNTINIPKESKLYYVEIEA